MELIKLAIEEIILPEKMIRSCYSDQSMLDLANSIEEVGILQPIVVMEANEKYLLVAGARRVEACKRLGQKYIPAVILSGDLSVRQMQIVENIQREQLNPVDRAVAIKLLMEEDKLTKTEVSRRIGVPRTTVNDWLDILTVDERFQQAVINNYYGGSSPLTISHISLARRFAKKLQSEKLVPVVLDAVIYYSLSRGETRKVLQIVRSAKNYSLEAAIRKVRLSPGADTQVNGQEEWQVEKLLSSLSRSGDYLVKTSSDNLAQLSTGERHELVRRTNALRKLLDQVILEVHTEDETAKKRKA